MTDSSAIRRADRPAGLGRRRFIGGLGSASLLSTQGGVAFAAETDAGLADVPAFPGQGAYEDRRRDLVWQAIKPDRYPAEIVAAQTEADIAQTVAIARATGRG